MTKNIAIITARGGSKRIPRKNIKEFLGKPIISYSISAALDAGCFQEIMVSTDDQEIAEISCALGAKVPFLRSAATSNDFATTADVLSEVLSEYHKRDEVFDHACCIYPTAPFVTGKRLRQAYDLLLHTDADTAIPVVRFGFPIQRAMVIVDNRLKTLYPEYINTRSQDLTPAYHDSGQFYFIQVKRFLDTHQLFGNNTVPFELPESEVQDIDNLEDWKIAEIKYQIMHQ